MLELIDLGILVVFALIIYFGYGVDAHKTRIMRLRDGIAPRGALPLPVMTAEFAERFQTRLNTEKRYIAVALVLSLLIAAVSVYCFDVLGVLALLLLWIAAYFGRAVANIVDRAREIKNFDNSFPLYLPASSRSLRDFFPPSLIVLSLVIAIIADVVLFIFGFQTVAGAFWKQTVAIVACIIFPIIGWLLAAYIARQPVVANSEADLRWEDRLKGEDIQILPLFGEIFPIFLLLASYNNLAEQKVSWIMLGAFLALLIILLVIAVIGNSIGQRKLWPDPEFVSNRSGTVSGKDNAKFATKDDSDVR